jgi:hypothetical protein
MNKEGMLNLLTGGWLLAWFMAIALSTIMLIASVSMRRNDQRRDRPSLLRQRKRQVQQETLQIHGGISAALVCLNCMSCVMHDVDGDEQSYDI